MLEIETVLYDDLSKGKVDASKWKLLSFPLGNEQVWTYEEPKAKIEPRGGGLALTVDPFTRKHDQVHMFDDPKQLYVSTRTFPVSPTGTTTFEVEMSAETYRSNAEDIRDAFAGFITIELATGMVFDFVSTGRKIGAIYERLLIPGITDEKTAFTYLIESPFAGISTAPGRLHHYSVRLNPAERRAEWYEACHWCSRMEPILNELAQEYQDVQFVRFNVLTNEDHWRLANQYRIMGSPTLVFFCCGRPVGEVVGYRPKDGLRKQVEESLSRCNTQPCA